MTDPPQGDSSNRSESADWAVQTRQSVEIYESEDGIVMYDTNNPLAWLQTTEVVALDEIE